MCSLTIHGLHSWRNGAHWRRKHGSHKLARVVVSSDSSVAQPGLVFGMKVARVLSVSVHGFSK